MGFYVKIIDMSDKENLHAGHRERMIGKFLNNPDALLDHELLEVLLFFAIPRKDTNPIAHKLLNMFGNFTALINATPAQLQKVDGIGKRVAAELTVIFNIIKRLRAENKVQPILYNVEDVYSVIGKDLEEVQSETFFMLMLNSRYKLLAKVTFSNYEIDRVKAEIPDIVNAIEMHKPTYAIIVHNHPSGKVEPSELDDHATVKINLICELHGVNLIDHIIFAGKENYSYKYTDRINDLKGKTRLNNVFSSIIKENKQYE